MKTIILNSKNLVNNYYKNTYSYKFPNSTTFYKSKLKLDSLIIPFSWQNINQQQFNNNE